MKSYILLILCFQPALGMDQGQIITTLNRNFTYKLTHTTSDGELKKNQTVTLLQFLDTEKTAQDYHIFARYQELYTMLEKQCTSHHPDMKALIALGKGTGILNADGSLKPKQSTDDEDDITKDLLIRFLPLLGIAKNVAQEEAILARIIDGKTDEEIVNEFLPDSAVFSTSTKRNIPHIQSLYTLAKSIQIASLKPPLSRTEKHTLEDITIDLLLNNITNQDSINKTWMTIAPILLQRNYAIKPIIKPIGESFSEYPSSLIIAAQQKISKIIQATNKKPVSSPSTE